MRLSKSVATQRSTSSPRRRLASAAAATVATSGLVLAAAGAAHAATGTTYAVSLSPAAAVVGTPTPFTATFTAGGALPLASADITLPTGYTAISAAAPTGSALVAWSATVSGNTVKIAAPLPVASDLLLPGTSESVVITATPPTTPGSATFPTGAADLFGGGTDDATNSGSNPSVTVVPGAPVALAFLQQPTSATVGTAISPTVTVAVLDRYGNLTTSSTTSVAVTLAAGAGTVASGTATSSAGVARFPALSVSAPGLADTLSASSAGLTSATSQPFNVYGASTSGGGTGSEVVCQAGVNCDSGTLTSSGGSGSNDITTTAEVVALGQGNPADELTTSLGGPAITLCDSNYGATVTFSDAPGSPRTRSITYTLSVPPSSSQSSGTGAVDVSDYVTVCYGSTNEFTARVHSKSGLAPAPFDAADGEYEGFLPTCAATGKVAPCVQSAVVSPVPCPDQITFSVIAPAGDPRLGGGG